MRQPELGDGWDLLDHVIAEEGLIGVVGHEGARMTGEDSDPLVRRVDVETGDVFVEVCRERVD